MTFAWTHIGRGGGDRLNPHHREVGGSSSVFMYVWQFLEGLMDVGDNCILIGKEIASTIISSLRISES